VYMKVLHTSYKTYFEVPYDKIYIIIEDELKQLGSYKKKCIYTLTEESHREKSRKFNDGIFETIENIFYTIIFIYSNKPLSKKEINEVLKHIPYVRLDEL